MPYANPEVGKARRRAYQKTPEGQAKHQEANQRWRERNRKRTNAHNLLNKAVARGKLMPWPGCACCDETEVFGHHPDYDAPLDVVWLCDKCHKAAHAIVGFRNTGD